MDKIMAELQLWMQRHNIPLDGAELHVVLPDRGVAHHAQTAMRRELLPHMAAEASVRGDGNDRLYGMPVKFTFLPR